VSGSEGGRRKSGAVKEKRSKLKMRIPINAEIWLVNKHNVIGIQANANEQCAIR
jgi:hypothetical protein